MTFVLILLVGCQILSILVATIAVSVTDKTTYDATTANATVPRGALILTMAGPGAPSYLQASCLSMASSAARFDMLIFHEDNEVISTMLCAPNVKKINLHQHGLSRLISAAICQAGGAPDAAVTARTRIKVRHSSSVCSVLLPPCLCLICFLLRTLHHLITTLLLL